MSASSTPIGEQIQELSKRLHEINEELHQQVRDKHGALLQQATHAQRFDVALNVLSDDVQRIRNSGLKLKTHVDTQFQQIENQTKVLGRLHELSHLLRASSNLLTLTAKLKNTKDVVKQAEIYYELAPLIDDNDLKDIAFIQTERSHVISSRQKIKNFTQMNLMTGLQERNANQVVNALKIFLNFNNLGKSLENLITTFISNLEQSLKECFSGTDVSVLGSQKDVGKSVSKQSNISSSRGPGKTPQLTTTQNFRAKFWKSLHWIIYEELYESCDQITLLKSCLEQINQFGEAMQSAQNIQETFWLAVQNLLRATFTNCASHVTLTLQEGLSKLLTSARSLEQRLGEQFRFNNEIFAPLEAGYIGKCAANMKACLSSSDLPTNETIDGFIKAAAIELSAALIDHKLSNAVAVVFIECGKELCIKLEAQIKLGADAAQVVDQPNFQQLQNIVIANLLFYYKDSVRRMLRDLEDQFTKSQSHSAEDIAKSLDTCDLLINTVLQQIIDSIISTVSIIILSLHREPGLATEKISTTGPSMYMKELQEFLTRSWSNHLTPFNDKDTVAKCGNELAKRCIDLFVHNLSILRPLSNAGRLRMKNDCMHLEEALSSICLNLSELGNAARMLRAMSFLIVQQPKELVAQSTGKDSLVSSYIVLFLLFGHAGNELQSPHTTVNWSNERLIEWLDGHTSEREKLELISGALQRYRDSIRRKNSEQFDEIYPLMVEFFEKAYKDYANTKV